MRLWIRLTIAMAVLAVVPVVLVGLSAMEIATRRAESASEERVRREAALQAELVGRWVNEQAPLVLAFPQLYGGRLRDLSAEAQAAFPRLVYRLVPFAVTVVLVDGDGVLVAAPAYVSAPGSDGAGPIDPGVEERTPSGPARVRQLLDHLPIAVAVANPDVVHLGGAWLPDGAGGKPSLALAVLAAPGDLPQDQRILGVEIELDVAEHLLDARTDQHVICLVDASGLPLVGDTLPLIAPERLRPLLGADQRIDFTLEAEQGEVRGWVAPVSQVPGWSVVVAEPANVVLAAAADIEDRMVPQLLVAIAIAVVLALVVASSLSRPVERLRDAALRVADGARGVHADVDRSDEIGELARAFDHMSDRLEANRDEIAAQQAEIRAFNRELQERVDERTRELREAQEELVHSGQLAAVAELGAGLAHELNNPLAAVLGLAQLLKNRHTDDPMLADLVSQAYRCREVVETMLRVQSLEVDPNDAPVVQLSDVLHQVRGLVGGPFRQRGVQLRVNEPTSDLRVRIDPVHGSRVLAQILNALRAGLAPGATVTVDAARDGKDPARPGGSVVVWLSADVPVADQPHRRDDWLASAHGLWVAHQILVRLGGRLDRGRSDRSEADRSEGDPADADAPRLSAPAHVGGDNVWAVSLPGA